MYYCLSFTPQEISDALKKGVLSVKARIQAMRRLAEKGWKLGVRLDPIIDASTLINAIIPITDIFSDISESSIHSVSLGPFRLPEPFSNAWKNYTRQNSFPRNFQDVRSVSYPQEVENQRISSCKTFSCSIYLRKNWLCQPVEE